jgi:hypothetical protein
VWTLFLLTFFYPVLRRSCLGIARWVLTSRKHLAGFVVVLFVIPMTLIAV